MSNLNQASNLVIYLDYNCGSWLDIIVDSLTAVGLTLNHSNTPNPMGATAVISGQPVAVIQWLLNSGYCVISGQFSPSTFDCVMSDALYS